jgi:hypothetical protein
LTEIGFLYDRTNESVIPTVENAAPGESPPENAAIFSAAGSSIRRTKPLAAGRVWRDHEATVKFK